MALNAGKSLKIILLMVALSWVMIYGFFYALSYYALPSVPELRTFVDALFNGGLPVFAAFFIVHFFSSFLSKPIAFFIGRRI